VLHFVASHGESVPFSSLIPSFSIFCFSYSSGNPFGFCGGFPFPSPTFAHTPQALASQAVTCTTIVTPYAAFPMLLVDPTVGLAWYCAVQNAILHP
jgi:hypothetical protein